ncbi:MAG: hypothetical protein ACRD3O_02550 [Terriglobia bacterium]
MLESALETGRGLRRAIVLCAASLVWLGLTPRSFGQQEFPKRVAATSSLTLIQPTDPTFESLLDSYFPGLSSSANYQAIRPFLVLVQNNTGLGAVAYAIHWALPETFYMRFVTTRLTYRSAKKTIRPQGMRLISPLFNMSPLGFQERFASNLEFFAKIFPGSAFPRLPALSSVQADVDGVVYSDGSFTGPNKSHVWQSFLAAMDAEHDEALAALSELNSSGSPLLLEQALTQHIAWGGQGGSQHLALPGKGERSLVGMYIQYRGRSAQDIARLLSSRGSTWLQGALRRLIDNSRAQGTPSPLARYF